MKPSNSTDAVISVEINANQLITDRFNVSVAEAFVSGVKTLENVLSKDVISKIRQPTAQVKQNLQEQPKEQGKSNLLEQIYVPQQGPDAQRNPYNNPDVGLPQIGGRDLNPFGGGQGGMLYDPFNPNRNRPVIDPNYPLPPGSVPPGARFDPLGVLQPKGKGKGGP